MQRVYWPENVIDWLGKWRPTCVMRHARGPFYMDLYSMTTLLELIQLLEIYSVISIPLEFHFKNRLYLDRLSGPFSIIGRQLYHILGIFTSL